MGIGPEIPALGKRSNRSTRNVVFSDGQVIPIRIGADIHWRHHLQIDRDQRKQEQAGGEGFDQPMWQEVPQPQTPQMPSRPAQVTPRLPSPEDQRTPGQAKKKTEP